MFCLYICLWATCFPGTCRGNKGVTYGWELLSECLGIEPGSSSTASAHHLWVILQPPNCYFLISISRSDHRLIVIILYCHCKVHTCVCVSTCMHARSHTSMHTRALTHITKSIYTKLEILKSQQILKSLGTCLNEYCGSPPQKRWFPKTRLKK